MSTLKTGDVGRQVIYDGADAENLNPLCYGDDNVLYRTTAFSIADTLYDSAIIVKGASDLSGELDSTKVYIIDGDIDMGSQSIEVPADGLKIQGFGFDISILRSAEDDFDLFTSPDGGSGNLFIVACSFDISGSNSQVFALTDATGFNAVEVERVNFNNCTSLGYLDGYRQGLWVNWGMFGCDDGLEFRDSWVGGFRATTGIVRSLGSSATVFKAGTGLVFNSRFLTDMNVDIPSGATGIDFSETNFADDLSFQVQGAIFTGDGDYVPNITQGNIKCDWRNNVGLANTYGGGRWSCTTATATTISASSTYYKLAGTTTYTDLQHMSQTTDNAFINDLGSVREFELTGAISVSGDNNVVFRVRPRVYDSSAATYIDYDFIEGKIASGGSGTRSEAVPLVDIISLDEGDRLEIWVSNETNTSNITMNTGGKVILDER